MAHSDSERAINKPDQQQSKPQTQTSGERKEQGKEKPATKIVVRRLPPTITQEDFLNQVAPLPSYNYVYLIKGDQTLGEHAFTRAYVNFSHADDVYIFKEKFDNYVFVDGSTGHEYPAVVEFAPFQKVPKKRKARHDVKVNTIEEDPAYVAFLEALNEQPNQEKAEYSYDISALGASNKGETTTPLLDFLRQRKHDRLRLREEKREERRRKEHEKKVRKDDRKKQHQEKKVKSKTQREARKDEKEREKVPEKKNDDLQGSVESVELSVATTSAPGNIAAEPKKESKNEKARNRQRTDEKRQRNERNKELKSRREHFDQLPGGPANAKMNDAKPAKAEVTKKVKKYSERREERRQKENISKEEAKRVETSKKEANEKDVSEKCENISNKSADSEPERPERPPRHRAGDPRTQRRIRNKDRPTMQIYKPGMLRKKSIDNDVKEEDEKEEFDNEQEKVAD